MQKKDGMQYAPKGKPNLVCKKGEFPLAAVRLDHGHIYGMCNGLVEAGGELKAVYDPDPGRIAQFQKAFPQARVAKSEAEILADPDIRLVASAAIPSERGALGRRVMEQGKDFFSDKPPFTTRDQLQQAREAVQKTGQKYLVYYSERLHVEAAVQAGEIIEKGAIGRVIHMEGTGPHRLNLPSRPDWFFKKEHYGGILCDIGSHQIEQFLYFAGARDAKVDWARVANYHHPDYPELEDFGDALLTADNGATFYFRVDWFTPEGLPSWGDGRTFIVGTDGYIELRKYIDVGREETGDQLYLVTQDGVQHLSLAGQVGFPFFGELIKDCLNRTETAMTQEHAFKAAELCLKAQEKAVRVIPMV
jgi:predicted dehydrogenase